LSLTKASNARIQVPLISVPPEHDDDDDDDDDEEDDDDDDGADSEDEEDDEDGLVDELEWVEAELEEASLREKRSDFIWSNAISLRLFLCASSHTPNWIIAPGEVLENERKEKKWGVGKNETVSSKVKI
jgi:hypothetical protein